MRHPCLVCPQHQLLYQLRQLHLESSPRPQRVLRVKHWIHPKTSAKIKEKLRQPQKLNDVWHMTHDYPIYAVVYSSTLEEIRNRQSLHQALRSRHQQLMPPLDSQSWTAALSLGNLSWDFPGNNQPTQNRCFTVSNNAGYKKVGIAK